MIPQPRDVVQMLGHVKWFLGLGDRPRFGRYTYWEKFDYWAVFWGMGIIGFSGLLLWFPTFFAKLMPGWLFNTHMRPEKFPMDPVIFTGRLAEHELRDERPDEYDQLAANGGLAAVVSAGFVVVILIILTLVQGRG